MYQGSWWTATGHDQAQNTAIESLSWTVSRQARTFNQQLRDARKASERLSNDLAGVSQRLESFMEYVDLRFDLMRFDHELSVHNAIGRRFAALASGSDPVTADIVDIEGYWLPPAALDLVARLEGGAVDPEWERRASSRDPVRFRLFRLSGGHGFERPELVVEPALGLLAERPSLTTADPDGPMPVARAWRSLWLTTADGRHGEAASLLLLERLAENRGPDRSVQTWREWLDPTPSRSPASTLRVLRDVCRSILEPGERIESAEIDAWRSYMEELAGEGSAEARSVLSRVRMLRDRLDGGSPGEYPVWRRPVGDVPELLRADLLDGDAPGAARLFALRTLAPVLRTVCAESYEASRRPAPMTQEFRTHGRTVVVTRDGVSERDRVAHEEYIAQRYVPSGAWLPLGLSALGVILFGVFLLFAMPNPGGGVVVGVVGLFVGALAGARYRLRHEAVADRESAVESFHKRIDGARQDISRKSQRHVQSQAQARSDHDAVMAALDQVEALPVA